MAVRSASCALAIEEYMRVTWHCCAISKNVKISKQIDRRDNNAERSEGPEPQC